LPGSESCRRRCRIAQRICTRAFGQGLAKYDGVPVPIYAVMPSSSSIPQKTRVMVDFLVEEFQRKPWLSGFHQFPG